MKRTLIRLGLAALVSSALFGCGGGGSDGVSGANGTTTTVQINPPTPTSTVLLNSVTPSTAQAAAWQALQPKITVTGVTINSPPVVKFSVTDANGNALVGLGNQSKSATATMAGLTNLSFTLAKLVPGVGTAPSKWVSYLVTKPLTVAQAGGVVDATKESCNLTEKWCGTYPTVDKEGTLVDNKDGTYQYTFARDITRAATIVSGLSQADTALKFKADLGDLSYDPTLTHRLGVIINGAAPGTGSNTPGATTVVPGVNMALAGNLVYDFRPDGGAVTATRNVVDIASCASCHNGKGIGHGNSRRDPNLCVTCHTDQIKYGFNVESKRISPLVLDITTNTAVLDGRAVGNYPNMVHKLHMGNKLHLTGYDFNSNSIGQFNNVNWVQDPRDCTKCHSGVTPTDPNQAVKTKDGDNWKNNPSLLACGSCHDNISFAATVPTGLTAHVGGSFTDDSQCASCHAPIISGAANGGVKSPVDIDHRAETPTANNPTVITGISTISYQIKSVAVDAVTRVPSITFRILKDGVPVTSFATPTVAQSATTGVNAVVSTATAPFQAIPGFSGGPSFYIAYAVPQDGVTAPADFNTYQSVSLTNLLVTSGHPKAGTLSAADANGYMTATLTGSSGQVVTTAPTTAVACPNVATSTAAGYCANPTLIKVPTNAQMATGIMLGNFTQVAFTAGDTATLTAKYNLTNGTVSKGLVIKARLAKLEATGYTGRRVAVQTSKCDACHEQLGLSVVIHSGDRNDPTACAMCHNTSRTSSGWAANVSTYIHALHAGTSTGVGGAGPTYAVGKRVIPFSWHASASDDMSKIVYPGILKNCANCHVANAVNYGVNGATLQPNLLWATAASGVLKDDRSTTAVPNLYPNLPHDTATPPNQVYVFPSVAGTNYGNVMSFTPEGSVVPRVQTSATGTVYNANALTIAPAGGVVVPADSATLVESPITGACFSCHDSATAQAHMKTNGGVIYGTRAANGGAALVNNEGCLVCHGYGRPQDAAVIHAQ